MDPRKDQKIRLEVLRYYARKYRGDPKPEAERIYKTWKNRIFRKNRGVIWTPEVSNGSCVYTRYAKCKCSKNEDKMYESAAIALHIYDTYKTVNIIVKLEYDIKFIKDGHSWLWYFEKICVCDDEIRRCPVVEFFDRNYTTNYWIQIPDILIDKPAGDYERHMKHLEYQESKKEELDQLLMDKEKLCQLVSDIRLQQLAIGEVNRRIGICKRDPLEMNNSVGDSHLFGRPLRPRFKLDQNERKEIFGIIWHYYHPTEEVPNLESNIIKRMIYYAIRPSDSYKILRAACCWYHQ